MDGILTVGHGPFREAPPHCCRHVLGGLGSEVAQLDVAMEDAPEMVLRRGRALLARVDSGEGVLVLTDVLGATPSNIAARLLVRGRIEGVAGVSLPMLIRALTYRDEPLATVVEKAVSGGCEGVVRMDGHAEGGG